MWELVRSGGLVMFPLLACSILAVGIVVERFWALQTERIAPRGLLRQIRRWHERGQLNQQRVDGVRNHSPLGRVLAAGLQSMHLERDLMREAIEDAGRHVILELERFLTTLGTIASISPLLGLLGTVIGMIKVFAVITRQGVGDPTVLSSGIAEALMTTAAGLAIAIPAVIFHRHFRARVNELVLDMERQAIELVEMMHAGRESEPESRAA
jgi:biopolymer transport protein ExbB